MKRIILNLKKEKQEIEITEDTEIVGLFIGHKTESVNGNLIIIHKKSNVNSRITIKSVLWDDSKFNFEVLVKIQKNAKDIDTYLKANALILSHKASANITPGLEIKENEVKAGHSVTIGKIDEDQVFYLQSRGLSEKQSKDLIVKGFIKDFV